MGFISEFKEFALKGNLIDTAVGFVMGVAFGKVTTTFVEKMFAPLVGLLLGGVKLDDKKLVIREEVKDAAGAVVTPGVAVEWGAFLTACIDFLIVAFVMFLVIKAMNATKKKEEAAPATPPPPPADIALLTEIRDLLKK
jgi:large conductance mechanosensitive channel